MVGRYVKWQDRTGPKELCRTVTLNLENQRVPKLFLHSIMIALFLVLLPIEAYIHRNRNDAICDDI